MGEAFRIPTGHVFRAERAKKVDGLRLNAAREVEKFAAKVSGDIEVLSSGEVPAPMRGLAPGSTQRSI